MTFLFWLVSRLPLAWNQTCGAALGTLIGALPGRYGERLEANYRNAFPLATARDLRAAARSAGRMMLEMPYFWMRRAPLAHVRVTPENFHEPVSALLAKGKGVILLSPHLGGYELLGPLFAQYAKCTVLFKPPRREGLKLWVERMRAGTNLAMAPANFRGVRMVLKALLRGEIVGILPDQCPPAGEGAWAPFFNKPAYTMTLVQRLQAQTGANIVLVVARRQPGRGHYHIDVEPLEQALPEDPQAATAVLNGHLERLISGAPDQYLWGYNRYRQPSGETAPPRH